MKFKDFTLGCVKKRTIVAVLFLTQIIILPNSTGHHIDFDVRQVKTFKIRADEGGKTDTILRGNPAAGLDVYTAKQLPKKKGLYRSIIRKASSRYDVDPDLVRAIIMAESGYNVKALSKKGAIGLMQLMPQTAEELGIVDGFNPEYNIDGGVKYFKQLLDQFDEDVELALAAYNAGSRKVKHYNGVPPYKSTQSYIKKVILYYRFYKNQVNGESNKI